MLVPSTEIRDWKDLQDKVAALFREMGYEVQSPRVVEHVRGSKEIDVYVRDPRTSVPQVILIECKHWGSNIPQDTVHGFRTVMADCGANTGIIVGTTGFQSGAKEAEAFTNVELRTWEDLQRAFGNEWFLRQQERMTSIESGLKLKDSDYLDQWATPKTLCNLMRFKHTGRLERLYELLQESRMLLFAMTGGPKSYDQPGPIITHVDEGYPGAVEGPHGLSILEHPDVRAWFNWVEAAARSLLARIKALETETFDAFDRLEAESVDAAFAENLRQISGEKPIRLLEPVVEKKEYDRLLALIEDSPGKA